MTAPPKVIVGPKVLVGLGELLWDMLPEGKQLGGAPANFSVMSARLGNRAVIASRLGNDALGKEARQYLAPLPADLSFIQEDPKHPTGSVGVTLTAGQAEYVIHEPVAWDFLDFTPQWKQLAAEADAVCFGTLAQRQPVSRKAIHAFLAATRKECVRVFDVNLRKPFYTRGVLEDSLAKATILKLNDAEMPQVLDLLKLDAGTASAELDPAALRKGAHALLGEFPLQLVCITMGGSGSLLVTARDLPPASRNSHQGRRHHRRRRRLHRRAHQLLPAESSAPGSQRSRQSMGILGSLASRSHARTAR